MIVAGAAWWIGVGKSITVGVLDAGLFIGIEGLIEGVLGFYTPVVANEAEGTFFRVSGTLQLTGHIWGEINFAIVKAKVDLYAYASAHATFEAYRATLLLFEAGVTIRLTVSIGFGLFSINIELSFSASIRAEVTIGNDEPTPWRLVSEVGTTLAERIGPVAYRRLPTGGHRRRRGLCEPAHRQAPRRARCALARSTRWSNSSFFFHPVTTLGVLGDRPGTAPADPAASNVQLVATLMARLGRVEGETLAPAEAFVAAALRWGLEEVRHNLDAHGARLVDSEIRLSELRFLSMAWLIFVDTFRVVLRSVVA